MLTAFISHQSNPTSESDSSNIKELFSALSIASLDGKHPVSQVLDEQTKSKIRECDFFVLIWTQNEDASCSHQEIEFARVFGQPIMIIARELISLKGSFEELRFIPIKGEIFNFAPEIINAIDEITQKITLDRNDSETIIELVNIDLYKHKMKELNEVQIDVLEGSLKGLSYREIAENKNRKLNYISKDVGPKLWELLTNLTGRTVNKSNCKKVLERFYMDRNNN